MESCYGPDEKVMMKLSAEDKTTGKLHEVKGNIKEKVGKLTKDLIWKPRAELKRMPARFKAGSAK